MSAARGTVNTNVDAIERPYYGDRSETLLSGAPVGTAGSEPPRHRAKDLIAELKMINGQIHRIMFQVERAVTRLGIAG